MKMFIKEYFLNIVFGIVFVILLIMALISMFDWIINPVFWIIECILISLALVYKKNNLKNNNEDKVNVKEYKLFTKFKTIVVFILLLTSIYFGISYQYASGMFAGIGEFIFFLGSLAILATILIINLIIRIYYRIKHNQRFDFKSIYRDNIVIKLLILTLIIIIGYLFSTMV